MAMCGDVWVGTKRVKLTVAKLVLLPTWNQYYDFFLPSLTHPKGEKKKCHARNEIFLSTRVEFFRHTIFQSDYNDGTGGVSARQTDCPSLSLQKCWKAKNGFGVVLCWCGDSRPLCFSMESSQKKSKFGDNTASFHVGSVPHCTCW